MTQMQAARQGTITEEMLIVAQDEGIDVELLRERIAEGRVVIPRNINHPNYYPVGIGEGLRTKTNANIGTSPDHVDLEEELLKVEICERYCADTIMDLSTGGDLDFIRTTILNRWRKPLGTVPVYQVACELLREGKSITEMDPEHLFEVIERQAQQGVDFMTLHCGITRESLRIFVQQKRTCGMVSRGGSLLAHWMAHNRTENPLYEQFDRVLEICSKYDVTISLGDGMRPGAISDAGDAAQWYETSVLGELTLRAWEAGVQVMIEGPGHVPIHHVEAHIKMMKRLCHGAPVYVLGPLTCDIGAGYDHITAAIGGAIAAAAGADFLCYVTPAEHLRLPDPEDVRQGIIAARIAAHSGDIAKGVKGAWERNLEMSKARYRLDWETMFALALDPDKAREYRMLSEDYNKGVCTMCGDFCAYVASMTTERKVSASLTEGAARAEGNEDQQPANLENASLRRLREKLGSVV
ncbi:MAG: phosphomethylpyrimidine synthase ThiC [Armatimonadetes bacterium]|nr:phosphomethylpyrimidine synthase ThiC [Armatimonadota bacterium]MCX7967567.1 phosphomethylpyrimidine synthase ThiC [Armatimonadota bacterium]MDW8143212.1 phosphomethylpyrimidine synthase ThiC [Armatimonadota bacterium]